jgi:hypothetical protein
MGGRWSFDEYRHVRAPIEVVWDVVSDHRGYSGWTTMQTSVLEQEGRGHPDGVGAIRFLGVGRIGAR